VEWVDDLPPVVVTTQRLPAVDLTDPIPSVELEQV
jgi:hypothetical protein